MPRGPKLTPEEKKKLKAQKKAERKRLAEEKKRNLKLDKLSREVKYGSLTIRQHEKNWKNLLLGIAVPEMQKDMEHAWHHFEQVVDAKDFTISLLMDEIKDAEEQYMMNIRSHCENVDKLIKLFREQLNELKEDNEKTVVQMKEHTEEEIEKIKESHAEGEGFLNMMLYGLEMTLKEQEQYIRCEYFSRIDEEISKNGEILQKLRYTIREAYGKLWMNTQDFLNDYYARTAERRKQYKVMNAQDESLNELMTSQLERIRSMVNMIKNLKQKQIDLKNTQGQQISDLLLERQFFADSFWALKTQLEMEIILDNKNLTLLTVETNESIDYLKKIETKGEKILELAALCRKYETQYEKVLPFPVFGKAAMAGPSDLEIDFYNDLLDLVYFWKRVGQADALRYSIYEERDFLKKENELLKEKIHAYCECLDCPPDAAPSKQKKNVCMNKIDGNEEMRKYRIMKR